jgi:SAM-dependent methyltransferase
MKPDISFKDCLQRIEESASIIVPEDPALEQWARDYGHNHRFRLAQDLAIAREHTVAGGRILEFGSSPPFLSLALARLGYRFCGLDIAPERFAGAMRQHQLDIRKVDFEADPVPFEDETFDVVLFNEVFEHLRMNLIATMLEVRRVLKTGGTLLLSTPNARSLRGIWMMARHHRGCHVGSDLYTEYNKLNVYGHMGHVREYTAREVSIFLSKVGFRAKRTIFRDYGPPIRQKAHVIACGKLERALCGIFPGLKPLFTLVCERLDN